MTATLRIWIPIILYLCTLKSNSEWRLGSYISAYRDKGLSVFISTKLQSLDGPGVILRFYQGEEHSTQHSVLLDFGPEGELKSDTQIFEKNLPQRRKIFTELGDKPRMGCLWQRNSDPSACRNLRQSKTPPKTRRPWSEYPPFNQLYGLSPW